MAAGAKIGGPGALAPGRLLTPLLLFCLLAALILLAGCKASSEPPDAAASETTTDASAVPPSPKPGELDWSMWDKRWDPNEVVDCPRTGTRETRAVCAAAAYLEKAAAAFNAPTTMQRDQTLRIRLAIDRDNDSEAAKAAVDKLPGETVAFPTRAGRYMRATLTGQDFDVKALDDPRKDLFLSPLASWEWDVTAKGEGPRVLTLRTFVEVPGPDGQLKPAWEKIEDREVVITVTQAQKFADMLDESESWLKRGQNWLVALAAFIAALGGVWFAIRNFGKKNPDDTA
jgi:hypothetical protein